MYISNKFGLKFKRETILFYFKKKIIGTKFDHKDIYGD